MKKSKFISFLFPNIFISLIIVGIIVFPSQSLSAAKSGLSIWTNVLIPSLLPFMIFSNLIVEFKFVDIIGIIINPITKFVFNVSGKGSLIFAISTVCGYPIGAKLASDLRLKSEISKNEAQRLISFCSTSGPLFIIGAVATGMFNNPNLGYLMIIAHYLGSISVGLVFRNVGKDVISNSEISIKKNILNTINTYSSNVLSLFGNAVYAGINTILMVGGYVIIFSVIYEVLKLFDIISFLSYLLHIPFSLLGLSLEFCDAFISGLFEITIGCSKISQLSNISQMNQIIFCSFLIGFSGFSILAQCSNFIVKTDLNIKLYFVSKLLHGFFASLFTWLLYNNFYSLINVSSFNYINNLFFNNSFILFYFRNYKIIIVILLLLHLFLLLYKNYNKNQKITY